MDPSRLDRAGDYPTGEFPVVRIDLSDAYTALRRRGKALRRRRILSSLLAATILATVFSVVGVYYVSSIPLPDALSLPQTTTVYYSDGTTVMARLGDRNRIPVTLNGLPDYVSKAVVAAEDPDFWGATGARITRVYARAATEMSDTTLTSKARAQIMAWKLEDTYSKQQILEFYLNTVYFGRGAYGIGAAAQAYFGKNAGDLTLAESILLAGLIASPGNGRYDPTVNPGAAQLRFAQVARSMVSGGSLDEPTALTLLLPRVNRYNSGVFQSGLDRPTGLVVEHALAELRQTDAFRDRPAGYLENGGFSIVTTIDARAQSLLEQTADEAAPGSLMNGQPDNLQAAAVAIEPGTGRVLAYYGGRDGTGADFAGWYYNAKGEPVGYGAHPPGQTFDVYALAAALRGDIGVDSKWDSPAVRAFPQSGRTDANPVRERTTAPCQPVCTLAEAATAGLTVPYFALTERLGTANVIDMARQVGIGSMWVPETQGTARRRVDLHAGMAVTPHPFGTEVALGEYPVTVLDQANAMATFADGGLRSDAHFVRGVTKNGTPVYAESDTPPERVLDQQAVADLTWTLSRNPAGQLPDGRPSATQTGVWGLRTSAVETAHAWIVGYTGSIAMAVWIGNVESELPLRDLNGARVVGTGLPAEIYRTFMGGVHDRLGLPRVTFPAPVFVGDQAAGNAPSGAK
jgi:membrane peptidoglycan carboxypeptidase